MKWCGAISCFVLGEVGCKPCLISTTYNNRYDHVVCFAVYAIFQKMEPEETIPSIMKRFGSAEQTEQ
jgi:hypothetical protein